MTITDQINYLGVTISSRSGNKHVENRIRSCRRAYYSLQGAGLCKNGVQPETIREIWSKGYAPVLLYGCHCVALTKSNKKNASQDADSLAGGWPKFSQW